MNPRLAVVVVLLFLSIGAPAPMAAQAVYGSVFGTATDTSGAVIVGATVTVISVQKATRVETRTNQSGNYSVTHLIPNNYTVRVVAPGFSSFEASAILVHADEALHLDARLVVGGTSEKVTVAAEDVPLMKTDRADVATTFTAQQVEQLPLFNRNFTALELLVPGTSALMWQHASAENPQGGIQIMVNGQHFSGTSYQLDGTDNPILSWGSS